MVQQLLLMLLLTYERCMLDVFFYDLRPVGTPLATGNNLNCNNLQLATFVLHFAVADYCKMRQRSQSHTHLAIEVKYIEGEENKKVQSRKMHKCNALFFVPQMAQR